MNGILIIDKPRDWTSHDVIGKLRGILKEKRIGHGGTLDPMATGVLPVFVGRATRAALFAESFDKEYIAGLRLGLVTDTQDITGTVLGGREYSITEEELVVTLKHFTGIQQQIPPMYSAVKIGGERLYKLARQGIEVERPPRTINISELEISGREDGDFLLRIICSKGTYVRTLCHDIGQKLSCGASMSSLRRIRAGCFEIEDAVTLEQVETAVQEGRADKLFIPVDSLFQEYPAFTADRDQEKKARNGAAFWVGDAAEGYCRVYDADGGFLLLGMVFQGRVKTVKSFFEVK